MPEESTPGEKFAGGESEELFSQAKELSELPNPLPEEVRSEHRRIESTKKELEEMQEFTKSNEENYQALVAENSPYFDPEKVGGRSEVQGYKNSERKGLDAEVLDVAIEKAKEVSTRKVDEAKEYAEKNLDKLIPDAKKEMQSDVSKSSAIIKANYDRTVKFREEESASGGKWAERVARAAKKDLSDFVRRGEKLSNRHLDTLRDAAKAEAEGEGKEINLSEQPADTPESEPK